MTAAVLQRSREALYQGVTIGIIRPAKPVEMKAPVAAFLAIVDPV